MSDRPPGARPRGALLLTSYTTASAAVWATFRSGMGWIAPLVLVLVALAGVLSLLPMVPAIAPFVYPLL